MSWAPSRSARYPRRVEASYRLEKTQLHEPPADESHPKSTEACAAGRGSHCRHRLSSVVQPAPWTPGPPSAQGPDWRAGHRVRVPTVSSVGGASNAEPHLSHSSPTKGLMRTADTGSVVERTASCPRAHGHQGRGDTNAQPPPTATPGSFCRGGGGPPRAGCRCGRCPLPSAPPSSAGKAPEQPLVYLPKEQSNGRWEGGGDQGWCQSPNPPVSLGKLVAGTATFLKTDLRSVAHASNAVIWGPRNRFEPQVGGCLCSALAALALPSAAELGDGCPPPRPHSRPVVCPEDPPAAARMSPNTLGPVSPAPRGA